jgi:hypothetical protein
MFFEAFVRERWPRDVAAQALVTAIAGGIGVDRLLRRRVGWRSLVLAACAVAVLAISASRPVFLQLFRADFETREQLVNKEWLLFRY